MTESTLVRGQLASRGVESFDIAIGNGSLMAGSDRIGNRAPLVRLVTRAPSAAEAERAMTLVTDGLEHQLTLLQDEVGVSEKERVRTEVLSTDGPYAVQGRPTRAVAGTGALALLTVCVGTHLMRRTRPRRRPTLGVPPRHNAQLAVVGSGAHGVSKGA